MIEPSALAAGVTFRCEVNTQRNVVTDGRRLRQVLLNLLMNGIKYNRPGGTVDLIIAQPTASHLQIEVRDCGIGMSPTQLDQLYEPFNRLGRERGSVDGIGLGLVVVKNVVDLLEGTLEVNSEEGLGTTFRLQWPVSDHGAGSISVPR